jgi:hypothetical protein
MWSNNASENSGLEFRLQAASCPNRLKAELRTLHIDLQQHIQTCHEGESSWITTGKEPRR